MGLSLWDLLTDWCSMTCAFPPIPTPGSGNIWNMGGLQSYKIHTVEYSMAVSHIQKHNQFNHKHAKCYLFGLLESSSSHAFTAPPSQNGIKLDGVGPLDSRPSTYWLNHFVKKNITLDTSHVTPDTWHLTRDTWHVTPDMWHMVGGEHSLKLSAPQFLRFGIDSVLKILN